MTPERRHRGHGFNVASLLMPRTAGNKTCRFAAWNVSN